MPIGFLTRTERERLNRFPAQIPEEDLRVFFLLSDADQTVINKQREAHTCSGVQTVRDGLANRSISWPALCANTPTAGPALSANGPTLVCKRLANRPAGQHAMRMVSWLEKRAELA